MAFSNRIIFLSRLCKINTNKYSLQILGSEPWFSRIIRPCSIKAKDIEETIKQIPHTNVRLNRAVQEYLKKTKEHEEFIKQEIAEYELGKKHLANMMGKDYKTMTQDDIDEAIQYLLPSGLFAPNARPMMKHPTDVFLKLTPPLFDETGRPFHYLFYTIKPRYNETLHDCAETLDMLNKHEDSMLEKSFQPDPEKKIILSTSAWLSKDEFESIIDEKLSMQEHKIFINTITRIIEHPYSYMAKDFIFKYRKMIPTTSTLEEIPVPEVDEDGRKFITHKNAKRKSALATVTVRVPGTGKLSINGQDIHYFELIEAREQILFPLIFTKTLNKIDFEATVEQGGPTSQAGAIRLGLSMALRSFVPKDMVLKMKLAGLLQRDVRRRERKKPGQRGARRKYTWLKR